MRILLVGEYSRLHNSLKEGLVALGHEVTLVGNGDGFKNYPADLTYEPRWSKSKIGNIPRQIISRLFGFDIAKIEQGIRFEKLLPKLIGYDIVQLINERPVQTTPRKELKLLRQLRDQNEKMFLLSCGIDYLSVKYLFENNFPKNIVNALRKRPDLKSELRYLEDYTTKEHRQIHDFLMQSCSGIIASDMDYVLPLEGHPKLIGLIPNPVNLTKLNYEPLTISGKIIIFLGINEWNYHHKGIAYFEKALEIIGQKYCNSIEVIVSRNVPYSEYIKSYEGCHILLDQVYAFDQGYNALEAMAKGKVVFTGAEKEFSKHYQLAEPVAINAVPDVDALVSELSKLIENPELIEAMSIRTRSFIESEHDYIKIANIYLKTWLEQNA